MPILGIDEVGRGPLAGPLVMGAVVLRGGVADGSGRRSGADVNNAGAAGEVEMSVGRVSGRGNERETPEWWAELTDSKKLSAKKREALAEMVWENAAAAALGWVSSGELDEVGMAAALKLATRRAVEGVQRQKVKFSEVVIDGTVNFLRGTALEKYVTTLKKADFLIKEVSAASIIAKVARDRYMSEIAEQYPGYGFEKHVGYGTAAHLTALRDLGPCPEHRRCFAPVKKCCGGEIVNVADVDSMCSTEVGRRAEMMVAEKLAEMGHQIVTRNHRTLYYEIDIVSVCGEKIYFTEVKYRGDNEHGKPLEAVTAKKVKQMRFAAESFLQHRKDLGDKYEPKLQAAGVDGEDRIELVEIW